MDIDKLKSELNIEGEIKIDNESLDNGSKDASIFKIKPSVIIVPKTIDDIRKIVKGVNRMNASGSDYTLTARAAGTCMSGGSLTDSISIHFAPHLNAIGEINGSFITTQMGAYYRDFEKKTLESGLILPSYPASKDLCAMGGIVNNNSAGEKTLRYGKTIDYIEEISMIASDGNEYNWKEEGEEEWNRVCNTDPTLYGDIHRKIDRLLKNNMDEIIKNKPSVTKNSSGYYLWDIYNAKTKTYNLAKLICGAQGTLGLVTETKFRLVKVEKCSRMFVLFIKNVSDIPKIVSEVLPLNPESFELYDDHTFNIAMKFWRDIARKMGGNIIKLGLQFLPEFIMVLTGGVPKIVLLAEFTGDNEEELNRKIEEGFNKIKIKLSKSAGISMHLVDKEESKKYWTFRRESFNLLRSKLSDYRTAPFIEDIVIHKDDFTNFFPEFEKLLDQYGLIYTIAGHVGDGNLHVIPLMKLKEEKIIEIIKELSEKVYELVSKYKGSISGEHNDGLVRTTFLHYMFSPKMLELFLDVKNIFDPNNIFNPGKKVNGDWAYSVKSIDRSV